MSDGNLTSLTLMLLLEAVQQSQPLYLALPDGRLIYANRGYRRWGGLAAEPPGDGSGEVLPRAHQQIAEEVVATRHALTREEEVLAQTDPAESSEVLVGRHVPVFGRDGAVIGVSGSFYPATRPAASVRQLQEERQRFYDITRASSDWIWETNADGKLTYISERITEIVGLPPLLLNGKPLGELLAFKPKHAADPAPATAKVLNGRPFRNRDATIRAREDELRQYHISGVPRFDGEGRFAGYRGTATDVTQQKQVEQQLLETNLRLESALETLSAQNFELDRAAIAATNATRAKDMFLASMSHELRTPLNAVLGFAEAMELGIFGPLQEDYKGYIGNILHAGRHLLRLIEDILDIARIESDGLALASEPVRVRGLIQEALLLLRQDAEDKDLQLVVPEVDPDLMLVGDRTRCLQVITNLFSNAVKYTPHGGSVGIAVQGEDVSAASVRITIWDTGPGISSKMRDRIFEVFNRGDMSVHASSGDGAGIGLAIAKRLARLMGGDILLESELSRGSRFTVELPAYSEPAEAEPAPGTAALRLSR